jgi:hypothetical protein
MLWGFWCKTVCWHCLRLADLFCGCTEADRQEGGADNVGWPVEAHALDAVKGASMQMPLLQTCWDFACHWAGLGLQVWQCFRHGNPFSVTSIDENLGGTSKPTRRCSPCDGRPDCCTKMALRLLSPSKSFHSCRLSFRSVRVWVVGGRKRPQRALKSVPAVGAAGPQFVLWWSPQPEEAAALLEGEDPLPEALARHMASLQRAAVPDAAGAASTAKPSAAAKAKAASSVKVKAKAKAKVSSSTLLRSCYWLPNRDQMSYSACQLGPTASYWFQ